MTNSGSQTPAGFYPNPENPSGPKRWWDGQSWTDYYETPTPPPPPQAGPAAAAPGAVVASPPGVGHPQQPTTPPASHQPTPTQSSQPTYSGIPPLNPKPQRTDLAPGQFPTLGETISGGWKSLTRYWKPLLPICGLLIALPTTLYIFALLSGFDGVVYNYSDGTVSGGSGNAVTANLLILVAAVLLLVGSQAVAALLIGADGNTGDRTSFAAAGPAIKRGFSRFLVVIGWSIVFGIVVWILLFVLILFAVISPVLGILLGLLLMVGYVFVAVKLGFIQFAIADGENVPFARSFNVSKGRFWQVFGQFIVVGLIGGFAYAILSIPFQLLVPVKVIQSEVNDTITFDTSGAGGLRLVLFAIYFTFVALVASGFLVGAFARMYRAVNPAAE